MAVAQFICDEVQNQAIRAGTIDDATTAVEALVAATINNEQAWWLSVLEFLRLFSTCLVIPPA